MRRSGDGGDGQHTLHLRSALCSRTCGVRHAQAPAKCNMPLHLRSAICLCTCEVQCDSAFGLAHLRVQQNFGPHLRVQRQIFSGSTCGGRWARVWGTLCKRGANGKREEGARERGTVPAETAWSINSPEMPTCDVPIRTGQYTKICRSDTARFSDKSFFGSGRTQ